MVGGETASSSDGSTALDRWSARKVQPVVVLYVVVVFAAFVAAARFIFHTPEAVKALVMAAVGAVAATIPGVIGKVEYRATTSGVEQRKLDEKKPRQFEEAFRWDELSHIVPMRYGFKYYRTMHETTPVRRFWKLHVCDRFSGEIHLERHDLDRILGLVERQGVAISKRGTGASQ